MAWINLINSVRNQIRFNKEIKSLFITLAAYVKTISNNKKSLAAQSKDFLLSFLQTLVSGYRTPTFKCHKFKNQQLFKIYVLL